MMLSLLFRPFRVERCVMTAAKNLGLEIPVQQRWQRLPGAHTVHT